MPYAFEEDAFCTLMLHCFKHPADAVNGVLLGRETSPGDVEIVKAVPLSHGMLALAPMLEAAFLQVCAVRLALRAVRAATVPSPPRSPGASPCDDAPRRAAPRPRRLMSTAPRAA